MMAKWSNEEIEILREVYPFGGAKKVSEITGRSIKGVHHMASRIGIKNLVKNRRNLLEYNEEYFSKIDNPSKAYWLGFIYADGCIDRYDRLHINLAEYDKNHLQKFLDELSSNIEIRKRNGYINLSIKNKNIVRDLYNLGVNYNKTYDSRIPKIEDKYINHWLRGYFDGDGSIGLYKDKTMKYGYMPKANISVLSNDMTKFISSILTSNNIRHSINKDSKSKINHINVRSISSILSFFEFLYEDSNIENRMDRKNDKFYNTCKFFIDRGYGGWSRV